MLQKTTMMQSKFSPTPRSWRSTLSFHVANEKVGQTKDCLWLPSGGNVAAFYIMSVSKLGNKDSLLKEAEKAFNKPAKQTAALQSKSRQNNANQSSWTSYTHL